MRDLKVLLYFQNVEDIKISGIGRAQRHQQIALEKNGVSYTTNLDDDYDLIHINTLFEKSYKVLLMAKRKGIPIIVHGHSTKEDFLNSFKFSNLLRYWFNNLILKMYRAADTIITPTTYSKKLIQSYKDVNADIFVVSNGIDISLYKDSYDELELNNLREKFSINKNKKLVIGIGFYFVRKGLQDFIEVAKKMPDIQFIWCGKRYNGLTSSPIVKSIKTKPDNVNLVGYIEPREVQLLMSISDLFFFPSYEETEGIVVLESLAAKLPILIRDIPVFADWMHDKVNCFKGRNNAEFIELINTIINQDNTEIINNGYKTATDRDLSIVGRELKNVYSIVLEKNKPNKSK